MADGSPYRPLPAVQRPAVFCKSCTWLNWTEGGYAEMPRPRCTAPGPKFDPIHGFSCDARERNKSLDCEAFTKRVPWWRRWLRLRGTP